MLCLLSCRCTFRPERVQNEAAVTRVKMFMFSTSASQFGNANKWNSKKQTSIFSLIGKGRLQRAMPEPHWRQFKRAFGDFNGAVAMPADDSPPQMIVYKRIKIDGMKHKNESASYS